jgi:hypothetical protein
MEFAVPQSQQYQDLLTATAQVIGAAVNHAEFPHRVLTRVFDAIIYDDEDGRHDSMSNAQVATIISVGKERGTAPDEIIQISVALKEMASTILGKVEPTDPTVLVNKNFFETCLAKNDARALASVLMHEWMHVAGFPHPDMDTKRDVPWQIGFMVLEFVPAPSDPTLLPEDVERAENFLRTWVCNVRESPRPKPRRGNSRRRKPS